jgi:hypothetical protein
LSSLLHRHRDIFVLPDTLGCIIKHCVFNNVAAKLEIILRGIISDLRNHLFVLCNELA